MALALLKRSDTDLLLPVACDAPERLAAELNALQPFFCGGRRSVGRVRWEAPVDSKCVVEQACKK